MSSSITCFEIFEVNGGWRSWLYLKVYSDSGLIGWSEFTESNGSVETLVKAVEVLSLDLVGKDFVDVNLVVLALRKKYRQSLPGILWKAISAIENALWDLKSQYDSTPIQTYFPNRLDSKDVLRSPAYWSHCPTTRIRSADLVRAKSIENESDLLQLAIEVKENKFSAIKTNLVSLSPYPQVNMPGFNKNFELKKKDLPHDFSQQLKRIIDLISNNNPGLESIVDCNFNITQSEFMQLQNTLKNNKIRWIEIDFDDYASCKSVLDLADFPICTGENILSLWHFYPIIKDTRIDIVSIDVLWNGLSESLKIAEVAVENGKRIAVHNYYSGLASSMASVFLEMLPEEAIELVEFDFDDVPWRDDICSNPVQLELGFLKHTNGLGWNNSITFDGLEEKIIFRKAIGANTA